MTNDELDMISFGIIAHAGDARSLALQAVEKASQQCWEKADQLMQDSARAFNQAHQQQTNLLFEEINGESTPVNMLLVHSQDHLMNAMTVRDLAELLIVQEKRIAALEEAVKKGTGTLSTDQSSKPDDNGRISE